MNRKNRHVNKSDQQHATHIVTTATNRLLSFFKSSWKEVRKEEKEKARDLEQLDVYSLKFTGDLPACSEIKKPSIIKNASNISTKSISPSATTQLDLNNINIIALPSFAIGDELRPVSMEPRSTFLLDHQYYHQLHAATNGVNASSPSLDLCVLQRQEEYAFHPLLNSASENLRPLDFRGFTKLLLDANDNKNNNNNLNSLRSASSPDNTLIIWDW